MFLATGFLMLKAQGGIGLDFKMVYNSARCLLDHHDPYKQAAIQKTYIENEQKLGVDCCSDLAALPVETRYWVYPPTIFAVSLPIAIFPMKVAFVLWTTLAAAGFLIAAAMMWNVGSEYAPRVTGAFLCLLLANSGTLVSTGNAASPAISLSIIGAWCLIRERAVIFGVICMAMSLALKPHDSALIWLALFLFGGTVRKRALQSAALMACSTVPVLLWVWQIAPHWASELHLNVSELLAKGGMDDPGPAGVLKRGTMTLTNLQSVLSLIRNDPRFYNTASYVICFLTVGILVFVTLRFRASKESRWLAMAFVAALTLLPFYHRHYDSKILLVTIPACAFLWKRKDSMGRLALLVTTVGLLMASDLPWAFYISATSNLQLSGTWAQLYFYSRALPVPCAMLLVAVFFLVAYINDLRRGSALEDVPASSRAEWEAIENA